MSHVIPDLIQKILKGQNPLHIIGNGNEVRHFTYGGDLAEGIRMCIESEKAFNEDFNLSHNQPTKIIDLAEIIWNKINPHEKFEKIFDQGYEYDVKMRSPNTEKAYKILGFSAKTSLDKALDEIIPWIKEQIKVGGI